MKGYGQTVHAVLRDTVDALKQIDPDAPAVKRAEALFRKEEKDGIRPSGRPPTERESDRRVKLLERILQRDADDQEVARLYESGLSLVEVGKRMGGRSTAWVLASLVRTETPTRPRGNTKKRGDPERIERLRQMRAEGMTLEQMGAAEHISRERIRQICATAGIDTSQSSELTPEQLAAVEEYLAGASLNIVSVRYGVGTHAIRSWVIRAGHVPRREPRRWEAITKQRAAHAARLYAQGVKMRAIADALGLARSEQVYRLLAIAGVIPNRQPGSGRHGLRP